MKPKNKSDNWQEEAPQLAQMEKINPFQVPEGYFDTLSTRIQNRIDAQEKAKFGIKIIPIWIKYAAAACLVLSIGISMYLNLNSQKNNINWDEIPEQEMVVYLQNNLDEEDTQMIFDRLNDNQKTMEIENINEQELETYLYQNL